MSKPNQWLLEAEAVLESEPRTVLNTLKGIENYLTGKESVFADLRQQKLIEEKTERLVISINSIREDYQEILTPGIEQRIELFSKSIRTNPDNPQTLKQIDIFRTQLAAEMEKHEEQGDSLKYIEEVFSDALGGSPAVGEDGSSIIAGTIEGVPITVSIDKKSNNIHLDTPTDGSCKSGMNALVTKLEKAHINLGPIRIINSGEIINNKTSSYQNSRHSA